MMLSILETAANVANWIELSSLPGILSCMWITILHHAKYKLVSMMTEIQLHFRFRSKQQF